MFNKKEIAELQAQVKALQEKPQEEVPQAAITALSTQCHRMISAQQTTIAYQEERIMKLEARISTLEKLTSRIIDYSGMTEGHLR